MNASGSELEDGRLTMTAIHFLPEAVPVKVPSRVDSDVPTRAPMSLLHFQCKTMARLLCRPSAIHASVTNHVFD